MEWVEVRGKTIDVAVEAALKELGIQDRARVEIEIIQEPERGFLGIGGRDAIIRVKPRPVRKRRRRRRKGRAEAKAAGKPKTGSERNGRKRGKERRNGAVAQASAGTGGRERPASASKEQREVSVDEQVPLVRSFLEGLVAAFGLEGEVTARAEEDVILAEIKGPQTEAMVGPRGSVIEAVHELTKTVLQRKTESAPRLRLDIAGYAERRREALTIYANQLIDQVLAEGGEIMLEPMPAGDRKVIHDAVAAREGVRSYSEGEAPQRYVVIAKVEAGAEKDGSSGGEEE